MKTTFTHFDKDGNGTICARELNKVLRSLGQKPTDEEVAKLISEADKDGKPIGVRIRNQ